MRIVVCDYSGHPFQIELSRQLAKRGHSVLHLHFAEFQTPKGAMCRLPDDEPTFAVEGIRLGREFAKDRFLRRRFQEVEVGKLLAGRALQFRPDLVVGCNMPLDTQHELQRGCAKAGIFFVFWLQDIYSAAIQHYLRAKLGPLGRAIGRYYRHLEETLLRSSDAVVVISDKFVQPLRQWGVSGNRIAIIPNWAPMSEIFPTAKDNDWARSHGLHDKLVGLYTGTLGLKHDPTLLLALAQKGRATGLYVVVVSEGPAVGWLAKQIQDIGIDNLILLPFQPMDLYSQVLGAGDIMLAMVGEEAASFSVPSKVLSYLAAGRPIVAAIAADNDAAIMIGNAAAGTVVAPSEAGLFIDSVMALTADGLRREALGRNARAFAENHFDIAAITDRFEALFKTIAQPN
jgi:colanic acid biosynthesis glycosyl transferase WcaI